MTKDLGPGALDAPLPFSRPLAVSEVPPDGLDLVLTANTAECAALAAANGVPAVLQFETRLHVDRTHGDGLDVSGVVEAKVRQTCVVTLDEFESTVEEPVDIRFAPQKPAMAAPKSPSSPRRRSSERAREEAAILSFDPEGDDPPDPLIGGVVDLGGVAAEFFALGLDPYPRKPDAQFSPPEPKSVEASAFSGLRSIIGGADPKDEEG